MSYAKHCVTQVESCEHPFAQSEWTNDTTKDIDTIAKGYVALHFICSRGVLANTI